MSKTDPSVDVTGAWVERAATGGAVLGGGGGGSLEEGLAFGRLAVEYGTPRLVPLADLDEGDLVVTVSAVGAPAATGRSVAPADYVRAFERVRDELRARGEVVAAVMTNEMGGFATVNGLLQAAVTGVPVVDAACNGRAHPTGPMGSMGLPTSRTVLQSAVGGDPETDDRLELSVEAALPTAADVVRQAAADAGGLVAVARNPVSAGFALKHAAVGVYRQAVAVGDAVLGATDGREAADRVSSVLGGHLPVNGEVLDVSLETRGGFDVGTVAVEGAELTFWNEYMTLEVDGERVATFPDLIATLDAETGEPVSTAAIGPSREVSVLVAPARALSLGTGMDDPALFEPVEEATGKSVIPYAFDEQ